MSNELIGFIGFAAFFLLAFIGMPIGLAFCVVGVVGTGFVLGWTPSLGIVGMVPYSWGSMYPFTAIPLFVLMGYIAFRSGVTRSLYEAAYKWIGWAKGGLAMATVVACGGFAAICASTVASAAAMGLVAIGDMRRYGYSPRLATGCVAAGGTIGIMIPPSLGFIIYGVIAEQSVGKLFIAGIIPGLIMVVMFSLIIYIWALINPRVAPRSPTFTMRERLASIPGTWPLPVLFMLCIGGIFAGVFTATEAGAIGALGAAIIAVVKRALGKKAVVSALRETITTTTLVFFLIIGAGIFNSFVAYTGLPAKLAVWIGDLSLSPYLLMAIFVVMYLVLGCVMETNSMILLTLPLVLPVVEGAGFDLIQFGVIMVAAMEMALITPPIGLNVFVVHGITEDVSLGDVFLGTVTFIPGLLAVIVLVTVFPKLALLLPGMM